MTFVLNERGVILVLCYINLLNYADRGIIPGAPERFQHFISSSLGVDATQQNFYLGLLATVSMSSTAVFAPIFGYLEQNYRPFQLIVVGMATWVMAELVSALSYLVHSYYLLLVGRVLSGIGDASFLCNGISFINRHAPKENSTVWLSIFSASVTVGIATGYVCGAAIASTPFTWAGAFFLEAILMLPAIMMCVKFIPDELNELAGETYAYELQTSDASTTFLSGCWCVVSNLAFLLVAFGHAAYTFTLSAFSVFGPILFIVMGFIDSESGVSLAFGRIIVLSGTLGTVFGGVALDRMTRRNSVSQRERSQSAVELIFGLMCLALASGLVMMALHGSRNWFLALLALTFFFMSAIGPAETVAVMEMFPESRQPMAVASNMAIYLLFGEIPAPVLVGWLKDTLASRCDTVEIDGSLQLDPECSKDRTGIMSVLLYTWLWLGWAVLLWAWAKFELGRGKSVVAPGDYYELTEEEQIKMRRDSY
ncbi:hypothetical protein Poli38472_009539 [Pythium oligandrum]|uniref:Major facilitator superfamily (MFS) profile domain-containing protein n=1 Tax=Pythium oligandrum TaxID=41045 RepID=A0A8K1CEP2_PYTOL|nr:hypothetical protein Poli38472_009539 [Pythium oligandrum]|eukprot:TMW62046.1 hypothetical protein Poli38472_009539 [Pythium oligandrum]